ncbi:CaiB/BaiF CoA transferase family protein [Ureibacillus sp. NPDC094379]
MVDLLADVRVLELSGPSGMYAGKILADLGADVIKVEPPNGSEERMMGPFYKNEQGLETSLVHLYHNMNKRSVTIDLDTENGIKTFHQLVKNVDVVIESFSSDMKNYSLITPKKLMEIAPGIIVISISPFGKSGPYKDYQSTDLVNMAMGGLLYLAGSPDSAPVRAYGNQSYIISSLHSVVALLMALYNPSPEGEHIDLSMQEAVAHTLENAAQYYDLENVIRKRTGNNVSEAGSGLFEAQDGSVYLLTTLRGEMLCWNHFVKWLESENAAGIEKLKDDKWKSYEFRKLPEAIQIFNEVTSEFFIKHSKLYLYENGQKFGVSICPISTTEDLLNSPQLNAREFFKTVEHDRFQDTVTYPGPPFRFSGSPWTLQRHAPFLGEHNKEIYLQELNIKSEEVLEKTKETIGGGAK